MDEYHDELSLDLLSARLQAERTDGENTSFTVDTLARELLAQGKYDEAEALFHEALQIDRESLGGRHPSTFASINNLGGLMYAKGDLAAAESLFRETNGDLAAAEPLLRKALEGRRETVGDRHPDTLLTINNHSGLLYATGDDGAAEEMLRLALELGAARDPGHFASKHAQYHRQPRPGVAGRERTSPPLSLMSRSCARRERPTGAYHICEAVPGTLPYTRALVARWGGKRAAVERGCFD